MSSVTQEMCYIHLFCFAFLVLRNFSKLLDPFADGAVNHSTAPAQPLWRVRYQQDSQLCAVRL